MLFIFDMDGVLYRGSAPVPHAADAIHKLRRAGHSVCFLTNNARRTRPAYIPLLAGMGIEAGVDEVITSGYLAALYFLEQGWEGAGVYIVGEGGLVEEMRHTAHCHIIEGLEPQALCVVAGIDRQFTYEKMLVAQQHILGGAHWVATNRDPTFPVEGGKVVPGAGSIVAAISTACGREPLVVGKPNPYAVELTARRAGFPMSEVVVVGDRQDTDIDAGNAAGALTVMVLTGVTSPEEAAAIKPPHRADITIPDLSHLPREWTER
jgi:phosphoglycolate/pyridoxal phosphate phosphatase family enzyme